MATIIRPQPPQELALASPADIVVFGGAAGGGKSFALLLEPLRHINNPDFGAVIFRRTYPEITNQGGLWDESCKLYPALGAKPNVSGRFWRFPSGARVSFKSLQHEQTVYSYQGSQIAMVGFDEATHFCMPAGADVLTEHGWKAIETVAVGERVASLSPDRHIEYQPVTATPRFPYNGKLICVDQPHGLKFKVTPNHRMVVDTDRPGKPWAFKRAEELKFARIPRAGVWTGRSRAWYSLPVPTGRGVGRNANVARRVPMDAWLTFLGWYFSEGCSFSRSHGGPVVVIRQTTERYKPDIRAMLSALPWRWSESKDGQFRIYSRQLFNEVHPFGDLYQKRIPRWVFTLPPRQLRKFYDAFMKGDGHAVKTGAQSTALANPGLIDDLQELAFLLGRVATTGHHRTQTGFDVWSLYVSQPNRRNTQIKAEQITQEEYKGEVYCLTVPPHNTFLVRWSGRYFWTGNSENMFWYLNSRNRSTCGIKSYFRLTCNPDADSWLATFIAWWIDQDTGYPVYSRAGKIRWCVRVENQLHWADDQQTLLDQYPQFISDDVRSVTFIPAKLTDNAILMEKDPGYRGKLLSLPLVERERLLGGNWKIRPSAGNLFRTTWFDIVDAVPAGLKLIRGWDFASTEPVKGKTDPDWTVGTLMGRDDDGRFYVLDVARDQQSPLGVEKLVRETVKQDEDKYGRGKVIHWQEVEGGSAGKIAFENFARRVTIGHVYRGERSTGDKVTRAGPMSAQAEIRNIKVLKAPWNKAWLEEMEAFPEGKHDDQVDSATLAFNKLYRPTKALGVF